MHEGIDASAASRTTPARVATRALGPRIATSGSGTESTMRVALALRQSLDDGRSQFARDSPMVYDDLPLAEVKALAAKMSSGAFGSVCAARAACAAVTSALDAGVIPALEGPAAIVQTCRSHGRPAAPELPVASRTTDAHELIVCGTLITTAGSTAVAGAAIVCAVWSDAAADAGHAPRGRTAPLLSGGVAAPGSHTGVAETMVTMSTVSLVQRQSSDANVAFAEDAPP